MKTKELMLASSHSGSVSTCMDAGYPCKTTIKEVPIARRDDAAGHDRSAAYP